MSDPKSPAAGRGASDDSEATVVMPEDAFAEGTQAQEAELAAARAKAEEHFNQYVRTLAEFDNYRKRAARDLESAQRFAIERFAQELLPALDGFELSLANAAGSDLKSVLEGQQATLRLLRKAFEKSGVVELAPAAGSAFNPNEHEAMVAQPSAVYAPNAVLETVQKGYSLNGRVLRPARVIVARAPDA
jgi:molecular chaperone GrpE